MSLRNFPWATMRIAGEFLKNIQVQPRRWNMKDRTLQIKSAPKKDEGVLGEKIAPLDALRQSDDMYPDKDTPNRIFNGIPFKELPVCYIRVSNNNTIMHVMSHKYTNLAQNSCGIEGFKNSRKGTTIAAQATAITIARKVIKQGVHSVRVVIRGFGPGRLSSVKGLEMAGLKIISVTDATRISFHPPRPEKQRRV